MNVFYLKQSLNYLFVFELVTLVYLLLILFHMSFWNNFNYLDSHHEWRVPCFFSREKPEEILILRYKCYKTVHPYSQWRVRSASSASSFSSFSGKCRLAHQKRPSTPSTTNTVISPNQNGSCSMRWDSGLYGMCNMRRSHLAPAIRVLD